MAGLEELMAGLFGGTDAPAGDEMRRRRSQGGVAGPQQMPGMMQQYYGGTGGYDYSGAMGSQMGGRQGLMSLLGGRDLSGPALRHFANQGFDFGRPGQDNRERPGGPNIAPGNIDNGQALFQPQGPGHVPGIPQGVAVGQTPGQVRPVPQTQGWRNVHPGYSAAAAVGTDQFGNPQFGGPRQGAPAAAGAPPGASVGGGGGGRPGGGGGGGGGPVSQNPIAGGGAPVRPGAGAGGAGGTGGGQSSGGKNTGGGGGGPAPTAAGQGGPPRPGNATTKNQNAADAAVVKAGTASGGEKVRPGQVSNNIGKTGGVTTKAGQEVLYGPGVGGPIVEVAPHGGQGGKGVSGPARGAAHEEMKAANDGKLAGLSPAEKAARKAAWEAKVAAKQEKARLKAAPSASSFGKDPRGSGTAPLPQAGKTKPKGTNSKKGGGTGAWQTGGGY